MSDLVQLCAVTYGRLLPTLVRSWELPAYFQDPDDPPYAVVWPRNEWLEGESAVVRFFSTLAEAEEAVRRYPTYKDLNAAA